MTKGWKGWYYVFFKGHEIVFGCVERGRSGNYCATNEWVEFSLNQAQDFTAYFLGATYALFKTYSLSTNISSHFAATSIPTSVLGEVQIVEAQKWGEKLFERSDSMKKADTEPKEWFVKNFTL